MEETADLNSSTELLIAVFGGRLGEVISVFYGSRKERVLSELCSARGELK